MERDKATKTGKAPLKNQQGENSTVAKDLDLGKKRERMFSLAAKMGLKMKKRA